MYDVIADMCRYLHERLDVSVSATVPEKHPIEFITIERVSGGASLGEDSPGLAIQTWSTTEQKAYELALTVRMLLLDLWEALPQITRVEVASIYNFPDPDTRKPRYQLDVYLGTRL